MPDSKSAPEYTVEVYLNVNISKNGQTVSELTVREAPQPNAAVVAVTRNAVDDARDRIARMVAADLTEPSPALHVDLSR